MSPEEAAERIRSVGLVPEVGSFARSTYDQGTVADTLPTGGATLGTEAGEGLDEARARRAIDLSLEKYCSVVASLAPDIDVPSPSSPGTEAPSTPISPIG